MKTKKLLISVTITLLSAFCLSSCQSKEERVISHLESLCKEMEKSESYDDELFAQYKEELKEIKEEAKECNFDKKQQAILVKLSGRFVSGVATKLPLMMFNNIGSGSSVIKELVDIIDGMTDCYRCKPNIDINDDFDLTNEDTEEANKELNDALNSMNE